MNKQTNVCVIFSSVLSSALLSALCVSTPMPLAAEEQAQVTVIPVVTADTVSERVTLQQCIAYAYEHNYDLRMNRLQKEQRTWAIAQARARFATTINASARYDIESEQRADALRIQKTLPMDVNIQADITRDENRNLGNVSLRISKVILGGGSLEESNQGVADALINEIIAQNTIEHEQRAVRVRILVAYYGVVRSAQTLTIQKRQALRAQENRERALERDKLLDLASADIQVADSEDRLIRATRNVQSSYDGLKRIMGMPLTQDINVDPQFTFSIESFDEHADWAYAQENHVDFLNFHLNEKIIERDLRIQHGHIRPTVNLDYTLSQQSLEDHFDLDADPQSSIGLSIDWTFGNMTDMSAYHQARIRQQVSVIEFNDLSQRKLLELRDLSRVRSDLVKSLALAQRRLELQEHATALYDDRWKNGEISILEFIRNQDALENTRIDVLRQKINYIERVAAYNLAVGR